MLTKEERQAPLANHVGHYRSNPEYPTHPDNKGLARVYFKGKQYYFSRHGTPESHVLYGLWLQALQRSDGDVPPVRFV